MSDEEDICVRNAGDKTKLNIEVWKEKDSENSRG